jgi:hypothetical protein
MVTARSTASPRPTLRDRGLRLLKLTLWFIEQRDHPSFPDWQADARSGLDELRMLVGSLN